MLQVVQNPEETIKYLINWLGWEWSDKYLSPQESNRSIFTASSAQVRKKINSNSSGYWKKYENLLRPVSGLFPTYDQKNGLMILQLIYIELLWNNKFNSV